jgi:hypothetical protein
MDSAVTLSLDAPGHVFIDCYGTRPQASLSSRVFEGLGDTSEPLMPRIDRIGDTADVLHWTGKSLVRAALYATGSEHALDLYGRTDPEALQQPAAHAITVDTILTGLNAGPKERSCAEIGTKLVTLAGIVTEFVRSGSRHKAENESSADAYLTSGAPTAEWLGEQVSRARIAAVPTLGERTASRLAKIELGFDHSHGNRDYSAAFLQISSRTAFVLGPGGQEWYTYGLTFGQSLQRCSHGGIPRHAFYEVSPAPSPAQTIDDLALVLCAFTAPAAQ